MPRLFGVALATALLTTIVPVAAAQGTAAERQRTAYDYARRCFVVDGKQDQAGAKIAYDAAFKLGRLLGLSDSKIDDDFNWTIAHEAVNLAQSDAYRAQLRSECQQLGMAS